MFPTASIYATQLLDVIEQYLLLSIHAFSREDIRQGIINIHRQYYLTRYQTYKLIEYNTLLKLSKSVDNLPPVDRLHYEQLIDRSFFNKICYCLSTLFGQILKYNHFPTHPNPPKITIDDFWKEIFTVFNNSTFRKIHLPADISLDNLNERYLHINLKLREHIASI
jgi:hypothetical protein